MKIFLKILLSFRPFPNPLHRGFINIKLMSYPNDNYFYDTTCRFKLRFIYILFMENGHTLRLENHISCRNSIDKQKIKKHLWNFWKIFFNWNFVKGFLIDRINVGNLSFRVGVTHYLSDLLTLGLANPKLKVGVAQ